MHAKYRVFISHGSKVIANVKVDNKETDKQTGKEKDRTKNQGVFVKHFASSGNKVFKSYF